MTDKEFRSVDATLTIWRGKSQDYLGTTIYYSIYGKVNITAEGYI